MHRVMGSLEPIVLEKVLLFKFSKFGTYFILYFLALGGRGTVNGVTT
jgi:hypothetical protein